MNGRVVGAILACVMVAPSAAQRTLVRTFNVYSCAFADSLLGNMKHGGAVTVWHNPDSTTFKILPFRVSRLLAQIDRRDNQAVRWPVPDLTFAIYGKLGQRLLAERPRRPVVALIFDDTTRFPVGEGAVGNYTGPKSLTLAPLVVNITPDVAVRLAKASKVVVVVDTERQQIPKEDLRAFGLFYRFAACDTIPYH